MSNQTFISVGPYWDVIHRHRTSFYFTLVAGLVLTALALVWVPKEYTSSVMLEVWHTDIQSNLIGAEPQNAPANTHLESRLEALSEETVTHGHLVELISKHGLYLRDGKPEAGRDWDRWPARYQFPFPIQCCSQRPRIVGRDCFLRTRSRFRFNIAIRPRRKRWRMIWGI